MRVVGASYAPGPYSDTWPTRMEWTFTEAGRASPASHCSGTQALGARLNGTIDCGSSGGR